MEKYFGKAYRGDPGIPHSKTEAFSNIWAGTAFFVAGMIYFPYPWQLANEFNYNDVALLHDQRKARMALAKGERFESVWNSQSKFRLDMYYERWPIYFP